MLRYRAGLLPWLGGAMTDVLTISSEIVTGYRLMPGLPADQIVLIPEREPFIAPAARL
jgi:hypothetical protein